jgi:hypothetical protein
MRAFTVIDVPQKSPQWFQARCGRLSGSVAHDFLAIPKSGKGELAGRRNLRLRLALEQITGRSLDDNPFQSRAMQMGVEREGAARAAYEALTGEVVQTTGFLQHTSLAAGVSLDGHIGDFAGIIEIKCPQPAAHLEAVRSGAIPPEYFSQVVHGLWLTGAAWADWISYSPDFPERLQFVCIRMRRDEAELNTYELAVRLFLGEVETEAAGILALAARESFDEVDARVAAEIRRDAQDHDERSVT